MAKANGNKMVKAKDEDADGGIIDAGPIPGMLAPAQRMDSDALAAEGFAAEIVHTLKAGEQITGIYDGPGGEIEMPDQTDPTKRAMIPTWKLKNDSGSLSVSLMGSAQLNARFKGIVPGSRVIVAHTGQTDTRSGRRCNTYVVYVKPPAVRGELGAKSI